MAQSLYQHHKLHVQSVEYKMMGMSSFTVQHPQDKKGVYTEVNTLYLI